LGRRAVFGVNDFNIVCLHLIMQAHNRKACKNKKSIMFIHGK
jgi:hypothetical protein